jgi:UDP-perosamine 4-acetyltransferase
MSLPVIVIGAGGHAKVLLDALRATEATVVGITDSDPTKKGAAVLGVRILGTDDTLREFPPSAVMLVNGIGSTGPTTARRVLFEKFKRLGYRFATVIHPAASVSPSAQLGEGVQVMAGGIIQPDCNIGDDSIVNTGASVDHDCRIGAHVHVAPGATLSGAIAVGDNVHIGTASAIMHGVRIGAGSIIGAGAVVIEDVPPNVTVAGVPARELRT